jgi:hypothetical protein
MTSLFEGFSDRQNTQLFITLRKELKLIVKTEHKRNISFHYTKRIINENITTTKNLISPLKTWKYVKSKRIFFILIND